VLVWLNGPPGVGATSTAAAVRGLVPGTRVLDVARLTGPLGRATRRLPARLAAALPPAALTAVSLPPALGRHPAARATVVAACVLADAAPPRRGQRLVVVPRSVLDPAALDDLLEGLRTAGLDVLHVTLHAATPELARRITRDTAAAGARERRLARLAAYERVAPDLAGRGPVVRTDRRTVAEVAAVVAGLVARRREG